MPTLKPTQKVREHELASIADWVHSLAPWSLYFTGTFEGEFSEASAQRAFERFMKKHAPDVTYFYSIERNPSRQGHHVHALGADCAGLQRKDFWKAWFDRFGRNRLEPVKSRQDVSDYCSKHLVGYLTKEGGWWNFRICNPDLWHQNSNSSTTVKA